MYMYVRIGEMFKMMSRCPLHLYTYSVGIYVYLFQECLEFMYMFC